MQLAIDSLDRLVALVEERGGRVQASEAARHLFAVRQAPEGLARTLLSSLVEDDSRLVWRGSFIALDSAPDPLLGEAEFVVFDLETTGLSHVSDRICEIGAVRIRGLELADTFETLVAPKTTVPHAVRRLTGLSDDALRRAPGVRTAIRGFSAFAGPSVLIAHNARFDVGFVNRELERMTGIFSSGAFSERASPRSRTSSVSPFAHAIGRFPTRRRRPRSSCGSSSSRPNAEPGRSPSSRRWQHRDRGEFTRSGG
jgi:Exonuclease